MADEKQDVSNGSAQSRIVLAKPRLGGFGSSGFSSSSSSSKSSNPFGLVLRPSQLKPSSNPFLKVGDVSSPSKTEDKPKDPEVIDERLKDSKEEVETPKFVPLGSTNVTPRNTNSAPSQPANSSSSGFVFGQNLSERVVMKEALNNGEAGSEHSASNGTSELLFTSAAASVMENQDEAGPSDGGSGGSGGSSGDGLAAAAAEYERSHARPPPPTTNCTMTGEEEEINVLQISCRLFAWEAGSWRERGRGVLRLNDSADGSGARLVARVAGSLRVLLNTKLWPGMVTELAGTKSLRITAQDARQPIKLYLIMGAPVDITQLYRALQSRIAASKPANPCKQNTTSQAAAERLDSDYDKPSTEEPPNAEEETITEDHTKETDDQKVDKDTDSSLHDDVDTIDDKDETKSLKRKESIEDDTSPKRRCPKILVE